MEKNPHQQRKQAIWPCRVLVLLAAALAGCGDGERPALDHADGDAPPVGDARRPEAKILDGPALVPGHENRRFTLRVADEYNRVDPARDGWQTEVIQQLAMRRLRDLGDLIAHADSISSDKLAGLAAPEFAATVLRPALTEVYRDRVLVVRRPADAGPSSAPPADEPDGTGPEALARALRQLAAPLIGGVDVRVKLKIVGITVRDDVQDVAVTRVDYQATGRVAGRVVQQNATWQCRWQLADGAPPMLLAIAVDEFEEIVTADGSGPMFSDCTESVLGATAAYRKQLVYDVDHWRNRGERILAPFITGLEGMALGDVNGDGLDDIYLCQGSGLPNRLFLQQADGTLRDAPATSAVDWLDPCDCALLVDLDNDGDQDLVLGAQLMVLVHVNDGHGRFGQVVKISFGSSVSSLSAVDYDGDGLLDLYVAGHTANTADQSESVLGVPIPYQDANNGAQNALFRNLGKMRFENVTQRVGLDQNNRRFTYAAAWEDYDNDGDLDLYVANDYGRNNLYQFDKPSGRFRDVAAEAGVEDIASGMSVSWGDYNNDGLMDLYVSNMFSSAGNRITYQRQFRQGDDQVTLAQIRRMARGNSLFKNVGGGKFLDVSVETGVTMGRWAWGSKFVDLNNDGREDIVVANGFVTQANPDDL
ncbi:MAG: VCBS repeat-containing protein [Planctomycetes bacterium]|nr:VCBS repeat-containing protein [Planctomycetota bacterium]